MKIANLKANINNIAVGRPYGVSGQTISEIKAKAIEAAAAESRARSKLYVKSR